MLTAWHIFDSLVFLVFGIISAIVASFLVYVAYLLVPRLIQDGDFKKKIKSEVFEGFLIAIPLAYLAWIVGYMTGFSRSGAVSDVVPAVLTFFGASAAILSLKFSMVVQTSMVVISFSTCLFIGGTLGSKLLATEIEHQNRLHLEFLKEQADVEVVIKKYREDLGLDWPPTYGLPTGSSAD